MDPILGAFREAVKRVDLKEPRIPYLSNVTGARIRREDATDPTYWARQLREGVRFSAAVKELLKGARCMLLEVGPGQTLSGLVTQHGGEAGEWLAGPALRGQDDGRSDAQVLLTAAGRLWLAGVELDWEGLRQGRERRRVVLPTYPFQRQRYWIDAAPATRPATVSTNDKKKDIA